MPCTAQILLVINVSEVKIGGKSPQEFIDPNDDTSNKVKIENKAYIRKSYDGKWGCFS